MYYILWGIYHYDNQNSQSGDYPFSVELEDRESEDAEVRLGIVVLGRRHVLWTIN